MRFLTLLPFLLAVAWLMAGCGAAPDTDSEDPYALFQRSMAAMAGQNTLRMEGTFKALGEVEGARSGERAQFRHRDSSGEMEYTVAPPDLYVAGPGMLRRLNGGEAGRAGDTGFFLLSSGLFYLDPGIPLNYFEVTPAGNETIGGVSTQRLRVTADWPGILGWLEREGKLTELSGRITGGNIEGFKTAYKEVTSGLTRPVTLWIDGQGLERRLSGRFIQGFIYEDVLDFSGYNESLAIVPPSEAPPAGYGGGGGALPTATPETPVTPPPPMATPPAPTATPAPSPTPAPLPTATPPAPPVSRAPTPVPTATPKPKPTPTILVSPAQAPLGAEVSITGGGFTPKSRITVKYQGYDVAFAFADQSGAFTDEFTVPYLGTSGTRHWIVAGSDTGEAAWYENTVPAPSVEISSPEGRIGAGFHALGRGFPPNSRVTLEFNGAPLTDIADQFSDKKGNVDALFHVPNSTIGLKSVRLTAGGESATVSFRVLPSRLTLTRNLSALDTLVVKGTGFSVGSPVTLSGGGVVYQNAGWPDQNGEFDVVIYFPTNMFNEYVEMTATAGPVTAVSEIFAGANQSP